MQHIGRTIARGQRALYIAMPTGTGKGVLIGELSRRFSEETSGRVLVIVHRKELVDQLAAHVQRALPPDVPAGIVMAAHDDCSARVIVATVQTLRPSRLQRLLDASPLPIAAVIIDEAHHCTDRNTYSRILGTIQEHSPEVILLGCTATPFRADRDRMQDLLPVCAFSRDIAEMQQEGWLAPLRWRAVRVADLDLRQVGTSTLDGERDYQLQQLGLLVNSPAVISATVRQTVPLFGSRPVAVFSVDVAHAQALADAYQEAGIRAAAVWGTMPREERAAILEQWRSGQLQLVANCQLLTEGFDFPAIAAIVLARPTQSLVNYLQMIGRGTRTAPDKADCLVIDVAGNVDRTDPRQILLPDVVPLAAADGAALEQSDLSDLDADADPDRAARLEDQQDRQPQRGRFLYLRDPSHDARWAWTLDPETGCYFLAISSLTVCLLAPDPEGSGLYRFGALVDRPQPWQEERARQYGRTVWQSEPYTSPGLRRIGQPGPLYELVQTAAGWLGTYAPGWAGTRQQPWLRQPATPAQLDLLRKLDPQTAEEAAAGAWTRGRVSVAITHARLRPQLPGLRAALWAVPSPDQKRGGAA